MSQPLNIRPDMPHGMREARQHQDARYLDKILMDAFTARTEQEVWFAESSLADLQEQCLDHIRFLSEIESFYRATVEKVGFDQDEEGYNNAISFIAGVGASIAGVTHQLGFAGIRYSTVGTASGSQQGVEPPSVVVGAGNDGKATATLHGAPIDGVELTERDLRLWAHRFHEQADVMKQMGEI